MERAEKHAIEKEFIAKKLAEQEKFNPSTEEAINITKELQNYTLDGTKDFLFKCTIKTGAERAGTIFMRSSVNTGNDGYVGNFITGTKMLWVTNERLMWQVTDTQFI